MTSAILCWGQSPIGGYGDATAIASDLSPTRALPSLSPPRTLEGTWVSDKGEVTPLPTFQGGAAPAAYAAGNFTGAPMGDDCGYGCDCADDAGGFGPCDGGGAGGGHGCKSDCRFNDLYEELQSHRRIWAQVDYLSWWGKGNPLPPLVTTSPVGTPQDQAGVLPVSATTAILYGNERVDQQTRNGGRINFGYWLIDGEFLGIEGQFLQLGQQNSTFATSTAQTPIIARPFTNVDPSLIVPTQDAALVSFPGFEVGGVPGDLTGGINVRSTADLMSAAASMRGLIWVDFNSQRRLDWIAGYRFFRLGDSVIINDNFTVSGGIIAPATFTSQDVFRARNEFHGGELGLKGYQYWGRWSIELIGKCAFGQNAEKVYINGSNTVTTLGTTVTGVGGLLTQPTNIGTYNRDVFAVLPEANTNLRFDVTPNSRLVLGYSFIYINRVQRSGDAIDTTLNPTQIGGTLVGQPAPAFAYHDSGFWVHGINAGFEYRW